MVICLIIAENESRGGYNFSTRETSPREHARVRLIPAFSVFFPGFLPLCRLPFVEGEFSKNSRAIFFPRFLMESLALDHATSSDGGGKLERYLLERLQRNENKKRGKTVRLRRIAVGPRFFCRGLTETSVGGEGR